MTIATYSELATEIDAWMDRSDLSPRIPTFIRLFEARINRRLTDPDMEAVASTTTEADTAEYALPSDFGSMRSLHLETDPKTVLSYMTPAAFRDTYSWSTSGQPVVYTIEAGNIVLGPTPDGAYTLTQAYSQQVPALTGDNASNWLLDLAPDAYLWGSLVRAEAFLKNDERLAVWKSAEDEAIAELVAYANRRRVGAGPLQMRPTVIE